MQFNFQTLTLLNETSNHINLMFTIVINLHEFLYTWYVNGNEKYNKFIKIHQCLMKTAANQLCPT